MKYIFIQPFICSGGCKNKGLRLAHKTIYNSLNRFDKKFVRFASDKANHFCFKSFLIQPFVFPVADKVFKKIAHLKKIKNKNVDN